MDKFDLGKVVVTHGIANFVQAGLFTNSELVTRLNRHASGDWGDLCEEDKQANDDAVKNGGRILSEYEVGNKIKIWIIIEWDRSYTTILFPEEY